MGYVYEEDTYKLVFEDPKMSGLEVHAIELTVEETLQYTELMWIDMTKSTARERIMSRMQFMVDHIPHWNLEDKEGEPVPVSVDALLKRGKNFHTAIMAAWLKEVVGISLPLAETNNSFSDGSASSDIDPSIIPMTPLQDGELPEQA